MRGPDGRRQPDAAPNRDAGAHQTFAHDIRNEELMMSHYLYKVIPRRPTFATDMSDDERAII